MPYTASQFVEVLVGLGYANAIHQIEPSLLQAAIEAFQRDYGLALTGQPDAATQERARQLVRNLQHSLNLVMRAQIPISEFYGTGTRSAVVGFQQLYHLPPTGIACLQVRRALEQEAKRQLRMQVCYSRHESYQTQVV
ncbi:peptidoglycan-binding domain-containing protein [Leptolyngbya sp. AN02str]|uniref:peptidoglycan-binding domain-containing protein n=1 Tax=Leptolyngbya sp. AN02str TaxID=3423363 RepID=UPI003D30F82C